MTLSEIKQESLLKATSLQAKIVDLHHLVQESLQAGRDRHLKSMFRGVLPNFMEGDFVLVERDNFISGEKRSLRWRGPRRVIKGLNFYVYQSEDL